jgi:hypothetical protein
MAAELGMYKRMVDLPGMLTNTLVSGAFTIHRGFALYYTCKMFADTYTALSSSGLSA